VVRVWLSLCLLLPFSTSKGHGAGGPKAPQPCSLLEISRKTSDHSLDSGFIPCSGPPWIPPCLVKRTLSTLLRFLLDHQEALTESGLPHCPRLATIFPLVDRPTRIHRNIRLF
ncbi:hypothetical protein AMECASPLE_034324, partial [Ameca splendens]